MKRLLLSLPILLTTSSVFAEGRSYDSGGCTAEQTDAFCSLIGLLMLALIVLVVVDGIWNAYKMRTDPAHRTRALQWKREYDEKQRRGY
ncbi:hypothetical protein HY626_02085 [Candidatus Uhrbacteria bacterium]|nr:hypothetical protein [Candidatus Uhrbacteria bacterium]